MTLMSDGFFPFPGSNWTTPTTTNSATASSVFTGTEYRLQMAAPTRTAGTAPSALTRSTMAFNSHQLTIAIDIATTAQSTLADQGSVLIESSSGGHAVLARADFNASTSTLTTQIGAAAPVPVVLMANTFYRLTFKVDSSDMATWTVGAGMSTASVAFSPTMVDVALTANWVMGIPTINPDFQFRNALVTTP
jgi:hypothetical protein